MTTKEEIIASFKLKNPTLRTGSEETGYVDLTSEEYEATIEQWADTLIAEETKLTEEKQKATEKAELLARLGITAEEAALLLA